MTCPYGKCDQNGNIENWCIQCRWEAWEEYQRTEHPRKATPKPKNKKKKRYLVPAVMIVHAHSKEEAEELAHDMLVNANDFGNLGLNGCHDACFLDELLPTLEVPIIKGELELPHSILIGDKV